MTSGDQTDFPGLQIKVTGDALTHSTDLPSTQADWGSRQKEESSQESRTWLESCPPPSQASHGLTSGPLHMSLPGSDIPSPVRSSAEMALLPGSPPRPPRQGPTAAPQKQQGLASLPKCSAPHFLSAIPTLMPGVTTGSRPWQALLASSGPFQPLSGEQANLDKPLLCKHNPTTGKRIMTRPEMMTHQSSICPALGTRPTDL